jgi:hypothetical protein
MNRSFLALILSLLVISCNQQEDGNQAVFSDVLPRSNGGVLDVLVVAEDAVWSDQAGEIVRKYMTEPQYGLPQPESKFTVRQVNHKEFNSLLRRARNLVILELDSTEFRFQKNLYAKPQMVYRFTAPTKEALSQLFIEHQEELIRELRQTEVQHLQKRLVAQHKPTHPIMIAHHMELEIPLDYDLEQEDDNLLVFWKKGLKSDQGIMVFFEPIDPASGVLGERIIPLRDSLTAIHFQGEKEGTYMVVEDLIAPQMTTRDLSGQFAMETRGLWRTKGDFMGGAFVNYTIFDEINNQRIMLDGFVYAPEQNKRNLLLELEAILQTVEIAN